MLRHNRRGSATVEAGLVLSLIAGGLLVTFSLLGSKVQSAFRRLGAEELASISANSLGTPALGSRSSAADVSANGRSDGTPIATFLLSLTAAVGLLAVGLVMAVRKRKRPYPAHEETPPEPVTKISELPEALFAKRQDLLHIFEQTLPKSADASATVDMVMSPRLSSVEPKTPIKDVRQIMKKERLRHLLVCDNQGKLLGVVSDRDLAKTGETAEQIMSKSPIAVGPQTPLISAVTILINRRFSSLPVVEEGRPVGILTTTDILLAMQAMVMLLQRS
ncbi:MAG: CBS domain-containing protein [Planctomycetales bacterium]|nr:CBS domain-containing protein [Planctomycetales bacterium]